MSARRALRITGAAAYHLLKVTYESSDVLPPLKGVAGGALYITDLVMKFRTSKQEWKEFCAHVQAIVATVIDSLGTVEPHQTDIIDKLGKLELVLNEVKGTIKTKQGEGFGRRLLHYLEHPDMIAKLKKKVDDAVDLLKFDLAVKTEIKVDKTLKIAEINTQQLSRAALDTLLSKLRYVEGASWDPRRVCLANTRRHIIEQVLSWVENADGSHTTNVLILTGVAGAGKSTIAHTVGKHYASTKQLTTSFFFDRETNDRNNPRHLISTIAADLCRTNVHLAARITSVIEQDGRITSAPISRQFEELIMGPCKDFSAERPLVILVDALDEGYDDDLLWILGEASRLPRHFCFVVTSRIFPDLEILRQKPHVYSVALDIHAQENIEDMTLFIPDRLRQVAEHHSLGSDWPDEKLLALFIARAEGLPLWVSTVCDYLRTRSDPAVELQRLVSATHRSSASAESKMDKLYKTILETFNWDDESFVNDYHRLMGAAVATKTPLTLAALGSLYQRVPVISNLARRQLSPLLAGLGSDEDQPVRPLHQSLRDCLTLRASSPGSTLDEHKFAIDERTHNQALTLLCLGQMNREVNSSICGVGYLTGDMLVSPGIPSVSESSISEELWYACRFWLDHLLGLDPSLSASILVQLKDFLGERLSLWMELLAAYGRYEGVSKLQNWVKEQAVEQDSLIPLVFNESQGSALLLLAQRLDYMGRLEEALTAAREGVEVYRQLLADGSSGTHVDLSQSLSRLSIQLYRLDYSEEALTASAEAVELLRQAANEQPGAFTSQLADAIHLVSVSLHGLGRHEEALKATEETMKLQRQLASEQPEAFTSDLAFSVHAHAVYLSDIGRHEEALEAIEEAVKLRRQLASERPTASTSDLAYSVYHLSNCLSNLGRYEEALKASEEAVELMRQLASERPAVFTSDLATSLYSLAIHCGYTRSHQNALTAIKESLELYRPLAEKDPTRYGTQYSDALQLLEEYSANAGTDIEPQTASVKPNAEVLAE